MCKSFRYETSIRYKSLIASERGDRVFLHIDNLELFSYQNVQKAKMFFEEIRDAIQVPDVYFVFVSKKNFFQEVISPSERVRSVFFGRSITVPPLSKEQVINAIHKRYKLLAISKKKYILPVEDTFIEYLYSLYAGKLRYIMDAMNMVLPEFASAPSTTIAFKDAEMCLSYLLEEHIKNNLTVQEWKILFFCTTQEYFHNGMVSNQFKMSKSNVARVIKRFLELDFVHLEKKEGRIFYYKTHEYVRLINCVNRANKKLQKNKIIAKHQTSYPKRLLLALEIIEKQGSIRHKEYSHLLNVSLSTATRDLRKLLIDNKISAIGQGKQRYYKIAKKTK